MVSHVGIFIMLVRKSESDTDDARGVLFLLLQRSGETEE
jgi:hypothetical protein